MHSCIAHTALHVRTRGGRPRRVHGTFNHQPAVEPIAKYKKYALARVCVSGDEARPPLLPLARVEVAGGGGGAFARSRRRRPRALEDAAVGGQDARVGYGGSLRVEEPAVGLRLPRAIREVACVPKERLRMRVANVEAERPREEPAVACTPSLQRDALISAEQRRKAAQDELDVGWEIQRGRGQRLEVLHELGTVDRRRRGRERREKTAELPAEGTDARRHAARMLAGTLTHMLACHDERRSVGAVTITAGQILPVAIIAEEQVLEMRNRTQAVSSSEGIAAHRIREVKVLSRVEVLSRVAQQTPATSVKAVYYSCARSNF
eukprot:6188807-Pleurochrysis_carterae.AAC.1